MAISQEAINAYRVYCSGCGIDVTRLGTVDFCPECEQEYAEPISAPVSRKSAKISAKGIFAQICVNADARKAGKTVRTPDISRLRCQVCNRIVGHCNH